MFYGWFKLARNKEARYKPMWLCLNDKDRCVLGNVHDFMKGKPQVLDVWPIFTGTKLMHVEVASFEEARFCLPRRARATQPRVGNPNPNDIPISKHVNKVVHHVPPKNDHDNRWLYRKNLLATILHVKDVHALGYGHV
jgi:hypothetical protein